MGQQESKAEKNRRGVAGWLNPIHLNVERWGYVFQRVTGLAILAYVIGHLGDTSFFVGGPFGTGPSQSSWTGISAIVENSFGHLILVLLVLVLVFHGTNGVRLVLAELGLIIGRPSAIEYPYRPKSLGRLQKYLFWAAVVFALLGALWTGMILFG